MGTSRFETVISGEPYSDRHGTVTKRIECADGFTLSVQASWGHYCLDALGHRPDFDSARYATDRNSGAPMPYSAVEVGYPSAQPEPWKCSAWAEGYDDHDDHETCDGWEKYAEVAEHPTSTVYGYVPVPMVRDLIAAHGGEVR